MLKGLKRIKKKLFIAAGIGTALVVLFSLYCNLVISYSADNRLYESIADIPQNEVGLLLGTSRYLVGGRENPYFNYRINAAVELYKAGKIQKIIASGDNREVYYNEPKLMRDALLRHGVARQDILLDYAGFRTLDSVVRCKQKWGYNQFTVISQRFHNQRAIYIASKNNMEVIGYNAKNVSSRSGFKTNVREYFAKVKAWIDINLTNKQPRFPE